MDCNNATIAHQKLVDISSIYISLSCEKKYKGISIMAYIIFGIDLMGIASLNGTAEWMDYSYSIFSQNSFSYTSIVCLKSAIYNGECTVGAFLSFSN